eukprot:CAMPEP_0118922998 /NCGR_PEP_ID=MMETSP1169-20130426/1699_1 /TAXON_ID=36882 /ORGANISM="Pyramimonas obovata, Strain CCMP722" /LENGTH=206 /DNA_ID=CAMNT_0006863929 /DNA_START=69 /DNA_END=686 /DNA_ORIENTATION=+
MRNRSPLLFLLAQCVTTSRHFRGDSIEDKRLLSLPLSGDINRDALIRVDPAKILPRSAWRQDCDCVQALRQLRKKVRNFSDQYGILFYHIPKNGGSHVQELLGIGQNHVLPQTRACHYACTPGIRMVTIRDPVDRFISTLSFLVGGTVGHDTPPSNMTLLYLRDKFNLPLRTTSPLEEIQAWTLADARRAATQFQAIGFFSPQHPW